MARNFLTSLRLVNISSDPPTGNEGELYYNTTTDKVRLYSNGAWIDLVAASAGSLFNVDAIAYPDYIAFDTTPESTSASVGTISWNAGEGGLDSQISANTAVTLGQEVMSLAYNAEATTLNKGEVVYLFGAQGQRPSVKRASNLSDATSAKTFGMVAESIASGAEGFVMCQGIVKNIDTNSYNEGDVLWLGSSAGTVTTTKPYAPNHGVFVGVVVKKNASSGRVFVKPQNGYEMDELHDVYAQSPSDNDILSYVSASTMWVKQNLATAITEVDGTGSNIDADLLDGQHGSYYQNAGNLNAGTILAARMPALTGDITTTVGTVATTLANTTVTAASYGSASAVSTFTVDAKGRLTAASNAAIAIAQSAVTNLTTDLAAKAPLASPALTGTPTAPTAAVDTNTTQIATTAYVIGQGYLKSSTASSTYAPITSPTFTGTATFSNVNISGILDLTSTSVSNALDMSNNSIIGVNTFSFADPGPNEGITWAGGNGWYIYESPDDLITNTAGNLQFVQGSTRRATIKTDGTFEVLGTIIAPAATTSISSIRLPHGTAPTSPTNGDMWTTTAGLYVRVNGSTVGPVGTGGGTTIEPFFLSGM